MYMGSVQAGYTPPSAPTIKMYLKIRYIEEINKLQNDLSMEVVVYYEKSSNVA